jgi:dipeptidyl aminopeptidase/acylaminoacyl peptidase
MTRMVPAMVGLILFANGAAKAQSTYKLPPPEVVKILDATRRPIVVVSPTRDALLLVDLESYPPIRQLARPILKLAGERIDPGLGAMQRTSRYTGIEIVSLSGHPRKRVALPEGSRISLPKWAPDGTSFAFTRDLADGVELRVVDAAKGIDRAIPKVRVVDVLSGNSVNSGGFHWTDDRHLLVNQVPGGRGPAPAARDAPTGPSVPGHK